MNRKQKIVLIIGAILLLFVIFTTPTVFTIQGSEGRVVQVDADSSWGKNLARRGFHKSIDLKTGVRKDD